MITRHHHSLVSFVVIAHNEEASIETTLRAILSQEVGGQAYEVLVIDDGSSDATAHIVEAIAEESSAVRLVRLEANRGRGFARAIGIGEARGNYIAMVDADIILPPDWLTRCLNALDEADTAGGIAVPDGDVAYVHRRFGLSPRVRTAATLVAGSNTVYRQELFDQVRFEGELTEGEDVAFSHALRSIGARTTVIPDLIVRHEETKSFVTSLLWMFQSGSGAARQLYRYREIRPPDLAFGGWLGAWGLAWRIRRRRSMAAAAIPLVYVGLVSAAHISKAFEFQPSRSGRWFGAAVLNSFMLSVYFVGRAVGAVLHIRSFVRADFVSSERTSTPGEQ